MSLVVNIAFLRHFWKKFKPAREWAGKACVDLMMMVTENEKQEEQIAKLMSLCANYRYHIGALRAERNSLKRRLTDLGEKV